MTFETEELTIVRNRVGDREHGSVAVLSILVRGETAAAVGLRAPFVLGVIESCVVQSQMPFILSLTPDGH